MSDADLAKAVVESAVTEVQRLTEEVKELKLIIKRLEADNHILQVRIEQLKSERKQNT